MYNVDFSIFKTTKKRLIIGAICILLFGIMFFIIGFYPKMKMKSFDKSVFSSRVEVEETENIEDDTMYSLKYYYKYNNNVYSCPGESSSFYPSTKGKEVWFDSNNPEDCIVSYDDSSMYILMSASVLAFVVAFYNIYLYFKEIKREKFILDEYNNWKLIKGISYKVNFYSIQLFNKKYYQPIIEYEGKKLKGDFLPDIPSSGNIDLLIDESNPLNYFIGFDIYRS